MERAGEFALGDCERAEGHAEVLGDLLGAHRPPGPDQSADASQGDDGARGPHLGRAVSNDAQAGGVGKHLPGGLRLRAPEAAPAPGGGQAGGVLADGSLVAQKPALRATGSNIDRRCEASTTEFWGWFSALSPGDSTQRLL